MFSRSMGTPNDHRQRRNRIYQDEKEGQNSDFEVTELLKWMCLDTPLQLFNFSPIWQRFENSQSHWQGRKPHCHSYPKINDQKNA